MRAKYIVPVLVLLILVGGGTGLGVFLGPMGGFAGNIDREPFTDAYASSIFDDLIFEDVGELDRDLWINRFNDIKVRIDPSATGTLLSASPSLGERFYGERVHYQASSVTIWVQNIEQQQWWEQFISTAEAEAKARAKTIETTPRVVVP